MFPHLALISLSVTLFLLISLPKWVWAQRKFQPRALVNPLLEELSRL